MGKGVAELRQELIESDGYEVVEKLRSFDVAYAAFKYHHKSLVDSIETESSTQYELSRNLIAYSGSITPLRDQAEGIRERLPEEYRREYKQKLQEEFDLQVSDFLIEIRHYVQHTQIPYLVSSGDKPARRLGNDVSDGVYIHIGELRERGRDFRKDKAKAFMENHDGQIIELKPLLRQYFESAREFNRWVGNIYRQENEQALGETREHIDRLATAAEME